MATERKHKVAIAVSGKGRSLENFLRGQHAFEVAAVISSSPTAGAVDIARNRDLPLYLFDHKTPAAEQLNAWLAERGIEWVVLAGFLKIFPSLPSYKDRVINIHPALLPNYGGHGMYGMKVHDAVLAAKEVSSGATVHFVNERYDEGAMIAQARVDLSGATSSEEIARRVFDLECKLYPAVLNRLVTHQLPLPDGKVWQYTERD